ncbi:glycosyltransferase 18 [Striga hermonthica]|uniref:Glycosyltransferase 18 n=1 Tax=Striga hermonthica TaxID=68872 RepID=A0A9N7R2N1_STRHE|nr:glycosyltransferase 18 [Striga hermonthica]
MLPTITTTPSPPPVTTGRHHLTAKKPAKLQLQISLRLCSWLVFTAFLQFLFFNFLRNFSSSSTTDDPSCPLGKIHVYDLPASLNRAFLDDCANLDPWSNRCSAFSHFGFGPPADSLRTLVPPDLLPAWRWTDMYSGELIYHSRLLDSPCTTPDPNEASAFYIPFYAGLAVSRYLFANYTTAQRDAHALRMLDWVTTREPFRRSNGTDHFIMLGRLTWDFRRLTENDDDWGTKLSLMRPMRNVLRLLVERSPWDPLEVSVPYPTGFHPRTRSDVDWWQGFVREKERASLFTFVGAARRKIKNDFRGLLIDYCRGEEHGKCRLVDCATSKTKCDDGVPTIMEAFLGSDFCLQPKGDGSTRRSMFDCMLAGSIPVYFWRESFESQYEWHLPENASSYSVFIDRRAVRNDSSVIRRVLEGYSREEVRRMRETIVGFLPRMVYSMTDTSFSVEGFKDAFDVAMEGVLRRFKEGKKMREKRS